MRKIILYIIIVLLMLLLLPSCNSIQPTSHSIKEQNTPNNTKQNDDSAKEPLQKSASFLSIKMVDERIGWAFNNDKLLHTSDGGEYWDDITPDIGNLVKTGIEGYFYDANTGWVVVQEDGVTVGNQNIESTTIFYTANGGKSWEKSVIPSYNLGTDMSLIDSNKAWLLLFQDSGLGIQKVEIYKTNNQGESWVKISDTEKEDGLPLGGQKTGISFINDNEGCIVRNTNLGASIISRTDDGGKTWREQLNLCEELGMDSSVQAVKPAFLNKSDGIIPVSLHKSQTGNFDNIFYNTRDGGKNWEKVMPLQSNERIGQQDYCFINHRVGWVMTSEGILYNTKDGGANWVNIWENTGYENIWCLNFVSDQLGWAIADNKIIKTVNGGRSWKEIGQPSNVSYSPTSSEQLKSILLKYTSDQIAFFQSFTFGDNQNAAFAIAGEDVWYITDSSAQKLKSNVYYLTDNQYDTAFLWKVDDAEIFKFEEDPGGSSTISYAWYVKDGKPVELPYTGMNLSYMGNGQFTTIGEDFDKNFTDGIGTGHTYKPYYLYWTIDGLKEYGGLKITQQQLLKVKGAQAIIDAITKSGNTVDDIFYRANNIININYHSGDKQNGNFDNVTLVYKNNTVTPQLIYTGPNSSETGRLNEKNLSDFSYGGIYQADLFSKIVTYPDKFPMN